MDDVLFTLTNLTSKIKTSKDLNQGTNGGKKMKLSEKTMNTVKKESETAIIKLSEGKTAVEIAGEIYCKALPDKDADAGIVMAKRIDSIICEYENNVKNAIEDSEGWVAEQIKKQLEGKDLEDRCKTLFAMLVGVSSLNDVIAGKKSMEELQQEYMFDVNNVSEAYENSLKEQLIAAVQESAYGEFQLRELEKALEGRTDDVTIGEIINYGKHEHDVKVLMAMIAYVNAKNGSLEDLPADTNLDEIAIAIASTYDVVTTAEQVEEGKISTERGAKIIRAISTVASFMIAAILTAATLWSVAFIIDAFLPTIIGLPLIIIAGFTFWGLFNGVAKKSIEAMTKLGAKIVKDGCAIAKKGAKKLTEFFAKHVVPKAVEVWNKVKAYFKKLKEENAETQQDETTTVQV